MFFWPQARRGVVCLQEIFRFVKTHAQEFTNLPLRKFARTIAVEHENFQGTPLALRPVKVHLVCNRVWKFNRENHASIVSKSGD